MKAGMSGVVSFMVISGCWASAGASKPLWAWAMYVLITTAINVLTVANGRTPAKRITLA